MNPISIRIPAGAEIANYLYPDLELADRTQDIVTVRLPTGYYVDAGWYPEHDPNGRFVIRVFRDAWDDQRLSNPIETRDIPELVSAVEWLADYYSRTQIFTSHAGETRSRPPQKLRSRTGEIRTSKVLS
jgi:hypothetical protein